MNNQKVDTAKTLVKVAGILLIVFSAISILYTLIKAVLIFLLADMILEPGQMIFGVVVTPIILLLMLIGSVLYVILGVLFLRYTNLSDKDFLTKRTVILVWGIIFLFSIPSGISGVLLIIAYGITSGLKVITTKQPIVDDHNQPNNKDNRNPLLVNQLSNHYVDAYTLAINNAIYNWHVAHEQASLAPIINALYEGYINNIIVFVTNHKVSVNSTNNEYLIPIYLDKNTELNNEVSLKEDSLRELLNYPPQGKDFKGYLIYSYQHKILIEKELVNNIQTFIPQSHIDIIRASIYNLYVDAIIEFKYNPSMDQEFIEINIGEANKEMHSKYLIEIDVPNLVDSKKSHQLLKKYYQSALNKAKKYKCNSVAFNNIDKRIGNFTDFELADIAINSIKEWLEENNETIMNIYLGSEDDIYYSYKEYNK